MTEIGYRAFFQCTALEKIDLSHIKKIHYQAFGGANINSIGNLSKIETINNSAFMNTSNLKIELELPNLKGTLGNEAFAASAITKVLNLGSVSIIGDGTNGYGLGPFCMCKNLTDVILPSTVTHIGYGAFSQCTSLKSFKIQAVIPPSLSEIVFNNTSCQISVPFASLELYRSATNWSVYASRIVGF